MLDILHSRCGCSSPVIERKLFWDLVCLGRVITWNVWDRHVKDLFILHLLRLIYFSMVAFWDDSVACPLAYSYMGICILSFTSKPCNRQDLLYVPACYWDKHSTYKITAQSRDVFILAAAHALVQAWVEASHSLSRHIFTTRRCH